mmetsp:Transcript_11067/g.33301  ORF Transcript_11067/g.33301 Transcript_11067/m.33301 type:complete len:514 (-) Transcript_11067:203-1744(-)
MRRRAVLLSVACIAAAAKQARVDASAAGLRWTPADEFRRLHPNATDASPKTRLGREVKRSIAACVRPRHYVNETENLVKDMIFKSTHMPLFTLYGRIFAPPTFLDAGNSAGKNHGLLVLLASAQRVRKKSLPNAGFVPDMSASGWSVTPAQESKGFPGTAIAKKHGYGRYCGIMIPNPYLSHQGAPMGDLDLWRYSIDEIRAAARTRPINQRKAKVFWRGECENNEWDRKGKHYSVNGPKRALRPESPQGYCYDTKANIESGNRARLAAASLTVAHSKHFDVKCSALDPPRNFSCIEDKAYAAELTQASKDVLENSRTIEDEAWIDGTDYTKYKYLLNLPGKTTGSYSRNLNHLWATGGVVLLWDEPIVEWYYPLLQTGVTHLVVNRSTAAAVVDRLEANPAEYKRLVAGAAQIDKHVMSPEGIAEYFFHVLEAIRHHVRYDLVLDDRKDLLELLENTPGACERLVEWKVSSRMLKLKHPNSPAREAWDVVTKGKNVCETLLGMKSDTPFYQF